MRDFRTFVRAHVAPLALASGREQKIVEEWAAQLEEIYDALRADGLSDDEAWSDIEQQVRTGTLLSDRLLDDALEVAWLARTPVATAFAVEPLSLEACCVQWYGRSGKSSQPASRAIFTEAFACSSRALASAPPSC